MTCSVQASQYKSSTGKYFVQALKNKLLLRRALCKLCSTKSYWKVLCASFVGKCFVQAL